MTNDAVSEVIGTVLIVAVTVILAAIVASLAFSMMAANFQKAKLVSTSTSRIGNDILITYQGGTNDPDLSYIAINAPDSNTYKTSSTSGALTISGTTVKPNVGAMMKLSGNATAQKNRVIVVGYFSDGVTVVLLDTLV
ncbi:MAG: type IV pilin N-terminal domain-containing protein [Methanoregula sp.]|nr:type IV pilin N-terminal domain-containing protein [Methanoregula sp.]